MIWKVLGINETKDKEAITKIEDFFQKLIESIALPNSDDNW